MTNPYLDARVELSYNAKKHYLSIYMNEAAFKLLKPKEILGNPVFSITTDSAGRVTVHSGQVEGTAMIQGTAPPEGGRTFNKSLHLKMESFGKTPAPFNIANDGSQMIINMPEIPKARRTVDPYKKPNHAGKLKKEIMELPPRPKKEILREALDAMNCLVDGDVELYIKDGKVKARILTFVEL